MTSRRAKARRSIILRVVLLTDRIARERVRHCLESLRQRRKVRMRAMPLLTRVVTCSCNVFSFFVSRFHTCSGQKHAVKIAASSASSSGSSTTTFGTVKSANVPLRCSVLLRVRPGRLAGRLPPAASVTAGDGPVSGSLVGVGGLGSSGGRRGDGALPGTPFHAAIGAEGWTGAGTSAGAEADSSSGRSCCASAHA
jgi:hypothetical protein